MKKALFYISCLFLLGQNAIGQNYDYKRNPGSFSEIRISGKIDVDLIKSDESSVHFSVENISPEDVIIENRNGILSFKNKFTSTIAKSYKITAQIFYVEIDELSASSGAKVNVESKISGDSFEVEAVSGSEIQLRDIDINEIELKATSGAMIQASGYAQELEAKSNSGGYVYAFDLIADHVEAKSGSGAITEVTAVKSLEAKANTGGKVSYNGNPKKLSTSTSLGGIIQKN